MMGQDSPSENTDVQADFDCHPFSDPEVTVVDEESAALQKFREV